MGEIKRLAALTASCIAMLGLPATASAETGTWGGEVSACNATSCYPGGTNRGAYVSGQAVDSEAPGYAWEVQDLALAPQGLGNGGF